ncbi:hypothetical protein RHGRI_005107 [Rhododendron griersonianum]|uniref:Uncharacterized protein n=1 Tax=Rhododendron griersonianum TaxID=479676 RepID=A0AAV6LC28_9ERIC|nr:hypothetical protein RHGRI_005107 [Rhododendron griersonianum]
MERRRSEDGRSRDLVSSSSSDCGCLTEIGEKRDDRCSLFACERMRGRGEPERTMEARDCR